MVATASVKKVRTISEGNFHGCYASNKAEKFKFRRLSLGIESCAQAQAQKLRKEEKALHKLLNNLEKEKEKHRAERENNEVYLQNAPQETYPNSNRNSFCVDPHMSTNEVAFEAESESVIAINTVRRNSQAKKFRSDSISNSMKNTRNATSNVTMNLRNRRHTIHAPSHDVTPFYMEHGYSHYHQDPHYDTLLNRTSNLKISNEYEMNEPRWKKMTKLSRLRLGCHNQLHAPETENLISKLDSKVELDAKITDDVDVPQPEDSTCNLDKSQSSVSVLVNVGNSDRTLSLTLPSLNVGLNNRIITPLERMEIAKYQRNVRSFSLPPPVNIAPPEKRHSTTTTDSNLSSTKALLLKRMAQSKLRKGISLQLVYEENTKDIKDSEVEFQLSSSLASVVFPNEISDDPYFDDLLDECDDQRIYPAYEAEENYSFEDFRSLRKCKYLRLSDLNIQSLKLATLENLLATK